MEAGQVRTVLVDCQNNIRTLEDHSIRFIAVTQGLDTYQRNPASRILMHVLGAAEFEKELFSERTLSGRLRYTQDFQSRRVGKGVHSRSGKDRPPHRLKKVFDREEVRRLWAQVRSYRQISKALGLEGGDSRADATGACKNFIEAIWNGGCCPDFYLNGRPFCEASVQPQAGAKPLPPIGIMRMVSVPPL
jgi:hypothetical protein